MKISDEFLSLFRILELSQALSPMQQERKEFLSSVKEKLERYENGSQYGMYYLTPSGVEIQLEPDDVGSWQKPWVSVIKKSDSEWRNAISVYILHEKINSRQYIVERGNRKDPDKTPDNTDWWEKGTYARRDINQLLNESSTDIEPFPKYFTLGSFILNSIHSELGLLTGFVLNGYSYISFRITVDGTLMSISLTWPYYYHHYLEIRSVNQNENLPEKILHYGRERGYIQRSDSYMDFRISENNNIKVVCDCFSEEVRNFLATIL